MTVDQAAKELGMSSQCIRVLMQKGLLPIGLCIKNEERYTYKIVDKWVEKWKNGEPVEKEVLK